mmetsp:Transcript_485/g.1802  ORF Transcript_485/g.1802 Transcript_485/m.1802 type:complete len:290 (-) Transcript_485:17-886(-)
MDVHAQAIQAPPPVQAMDADPTVVDAAVRFCDDVLASPYVTLGTHPLGTSPIDPNSRKPFTVTLPITDSSGEKALSMIIEVPELYQWHGSIVTAEGVSVARMSNKSRARRCIPFPKKGTHHVGCKEVFTAPVPVEWDQSGKIFAEVNEESECNDCSLDRNFRIVAGTKSNGPRDRIYLSVAESNPTRIKLAKAACWLFPLCFVVPHLVMVCSFCCLSLKEEHAFRDGHEEKVIGKRVSSNSCMPMQPGFQDTSLHLEGMTSEQRRLALVAVMYEAGDYYSGRSTRQPGG